MTLRGREILHFVQDDVTFEMTFFVYILTNRSKTLYVGITNDLTRRILEHKSRQVPGFTKR